MKNLSGTFRAVEQIFVDIINNEIDVLPENVWVKNQNFKIPDAADELFIAVGMVDASVIQSKNSSFDVDGVFTEVQEVIQRENIQIDLISRDNKALLMRAQVLMALNSIFSKQKQEEYSFKIFRIPTSFVNSSEAEGTSQLNRFSIVVPTHVWYRKERAVGSEDYYDDFDTRVDDENTISETNGLIEFNMKEG